MAIGIKAEANVPFLQMRDLDVLKRMLYHFCTTPADDTYYSTFSSSCHPVFRGLLTMMNHHSLFQMENNQFGIARSGFRPSDLVIQFPSIRNLSYEIHFAYVLRPRQYLYLRILECSDFADLFLRNEDKSGAGGREIFAII